MSARYNYLTSGDITIKMSTSNFLFRLKTVFEGISTSVSLRSILHNFNSKFFSVSRSYLNKLGGMPGQSVRQSARGSRQYSFQLNHLF